jgi:hypothetical protein
VAGLLLGDGCDEGDELFAEALQLLPGIAWGGGLYLGLNSWVLELNL